MYRFERIKNITQEKIEDKIALIGIVITVETDENRDKIEIEDGSGKLLISYDKSTNLSPSSKILAIGTIKLTPKGIMLYSDAIIDLSSVNPKMLSKFIEKIENYAN